MKTIVAGINCIAIADSTTSLSGYLLFIETDYNASLSRVESLSKATNF